MPECTGHGPQGRCRILAALAFPSATPELLIRSAALRTYLNPQSFLPYLQTREERITLDSGTGLHCDSSFPNHAAGPAGSEEGRE